jgi:uncharacterized membrane protein
MAFTHPANIQQVDEASYGERMADKVAAGFGSWKFIWIQTVLVVIWMTLNITGLLFQWDKYPFILLNLVFSTQAAYAAPLILLSQNRQSDHDRIRAETDLATDVEALNILKSIAAEFNIPVKE